MHFKSVSVYVNLSKNSLSPKYGMYKTLVPFLPLFFFFLIFIEVQLIYDVLFQVYSKVNHLYIYIYPLFFRFYSHIGLYRVLSRVPCAIQQVLVVCLFYIQECVYVNPHLPTYPSPPYPLVTTSLFSTSVTLFLSCKQVHFYHFLYSTYKQYHMMFVFLCLTYFTQYDNLQVHPCCCKWHYFILLFYMAEQYSIVCVCVCVCVYLTNIQDYQLV